MSFQLMPVEDSVMRLRLRRQLMGMFSYLMFLLPLTFAVEQGWMAFGYAGLLWFSALAFALNVGFFLAIRSGLSLRLADPGLTWPQIGLAMALALVLIHFSNEARSHLLMLFVASLFFGVFGLNRLQFLIITASAIVGYALLLAWESSLGMLDDARFRIEALNLMVLGMMLTWLSLIGSYVVRLRERLASKREQLEVALQRLTRLVSHDELTGAYNRRHLMDILERESERAERCKHTFSVCLIDIDRFKSVNDRFGHAVGDEVLQQFCERMRHAARRIDWVGRHGDDSTFGRYGGEEFLLVMPYSTLIGAQRCLERLRAELQSRPYDTAAGPLSVTFSAGVAEHRPGESAAATLERADQALYRAKNAGRNQSQLAA
jgi:diguanylate cyclase (GGDEF)-like protein